MQEHRWIIGLFVIKTDLQDHSHMLVYKHPKSYVLNVWCLRLTIANQRLVDSAEFDLNIYLIARPT